MRAGIASITAGVPFLGLLSFVTADGYRVDTDDIPAPTEGGQPSKVASATLLKHHIYTLKIGRRRLILFF
ncbi:hypothetical protein A7326_00085 [Stenotrophomonas maltophilia]|nr:hypothetical protein A7326_00085 [Stenotrophomonas maltophilia]